jgi:alcohol dehydrogenase class IV
MSKSNWNYPTTMWVGENRIKDLSLACKILEIKKPLLVTDKGLTKSKIFLNATELLEKENVKVDVFSDVVGNPTGNNVKEGVNFFKKKKM